MELRALTGVGWPALADVFTAAFSDYAVKLVMTADALAAMQTRRGYDPAVSFGAYADDALVGFALTCRDDTTTPRHPRGGRIYNSGTGVVPAHRRTGLARRLIDAVIAACDAPYVLEVLEDNAGAIALYQAAGFAIIRRLQCWSYDGPREELGPRAELDAWHGSLARTFDVEPAWQNSLASIARATEPYVTLGDARGYVVVFPATGDVPLLWVDPAARRRGHGRRLLAGAAACANKPLRILNVDASATGIASFLAAAGCVATVAQLEMGTVHTYSTSDA